MLTGGRQAGASVPDPRKPAARDEILHGYQGHKVLRVLFEFASENKTEINLGGQRPRRGQPLIMAIAEAAWTSKRVKSRESQTMIVREHIDRSSACAIYQIRNLAYGSSCARAVEADDANRARAVLCKWRWTPRWPRSTPVIDGSGNLLAVNGKMSIDTARSTAPELAELRDPRRASRRDACPPAGLTTSAPANRLHGQRPGLAMATMDMTKLFVGSPANFLASRRARPTHWRRWSASSWPIRT